jgi:parallel beta-helix repeat protein/predicted outer membrane repeat protein
MKHLLTSLLLLSFCSSAGAQSTYYVPDDFPTIQLGIAGSSNGDTVIVRDGSYDESITLDSSKHITLKSENGPANCSIVNSVGNIVVNFIDLGTTSVIDGFTIGWTSNTGIDVSHGGSPTILNCIIEECDDNGIDISGSPTVENCIIRNCSAGGVAGGGIEIHSNWPDAVITNCTIEHCSAQYGAGIYLHGSASAIITSCTLKNGIAGYEGGGLYSDVGALSLTLDDCTFLDNIAHRSAGGMGFTGSSPTLNNCTFTNNSCDEDGGGMRFNAGSEPTLNNCTFANNTAGNNGGGISVHDSGVASTLNLNSCSIQNNTAVLDGGGVSLLGASAEIVNCAFDANSSGYFGGGVAINNGSFDVLIEDNLFSGNESKYGGAVGIHASTPIVIHNNLFYNNHANIDPVSDAGGIYIGWNVNPVTISANTLSGNTATRHGGAIMLDYQSHANIRDCIAWDNSSLGGEQIKIFNSSSTVTATYSDIEGGWSGVGNIDSDPLFSDAANGNYSLSVGSPCIDSGDPNSPLDPDGTPADMGYYYPPTTDTDSDGLSDYYELAYGTDPLDQDTDDDGLSDGEEVYSFFTEPLSLDTDNDGIQDGTEVGNDQWWFGEPWNGISGTDTSINIPDTDPSTTTNPLDDDTDNDGLMDGQEDVNQDGEFMGIELDPNDFDCDNDGLGDGLELGLAVPNGNDTDMTVFVADADPSTTTRATFRDTDGGGIHDGLEDANRNGMIDAGEIDPRDSSDDSVYLKHNGASVGGHTTLNFYACEPGSWMFLCYSLAGAGPTAFTNVTLDLTQPIGTFSSIRIDSNGSGQVGPLPVPASVSVGDQAWFQGVQVSIFGTSTVLTTTNMTPLTIQ